jgi:hypothetical protein
LAFSGTNKISPLLNRILGDKFHSNNEIGADEVHEFIEEGFSLKINGNGEVPYARHRKLGHPKESFWSF